VESFDTQSRLKYKYCEYLDTAQGVNDLRGNSKHTRRIGSMNPANPVIRTAVLTLTVFKVPVIPSIGEPVKRVVGSNRISAPSRHSDTEMLNVARRGGEIDTIHQGIDRGADRLGDTTR